jgi:hypothetical protein
MSNKILILILTFNRQTAQICPIHYTHFSSECENLALQWAFKLIGALTTAENWHLKSHLEVRNDSNITCIYRYSLYCTLNTPHPHDNNQYVLYGEIITICSELCTKHGNAPFGQNVEFLNVEIGGT